MRDGDGGSGEQAAAKYSAPRVRATTMTYGEKHSFVFRTNATEGGNVSSPMAAQVRRSGVRMLGCRAARSAGMVAA